MAAGTVATHPGDTMQPRYILIISQPFFLCPLSYVFCLLPPRKLVMAESGCPASLIRLTSCPDVDCKRLAVMTLCNLTANSETRSAATRGGGLQAAVRLTSDSDGECRRYAATCVCNMANDHQMQVCARREFDRLRSRFCVVCLL